MTTRIIIAAAVALAATAMFAYIASGDPETVIVVIQCDDCAELDGRTVEIGDKTYVLALPTPTPTPTPTATPEVGFVPLTDENWAKARGAWWNLSIVLNGRILTVDETSNIRFALEQYDAAYFIHRCLVNSYEFPKLREAVLSRWANAEYVGDVSKNPNANNIKHFGHLNEFSPPTSRIVRSIYRIEGDLYVAAKMGVNSETCGTASIYNSGHTVLFDFEYAVFDDSKDWYVEMTWHNPRTEWVCCKEGTANWYLERTEGYWEKDDTIGKIREHILYPLTNAEVESGNILCRVRCDGGENLDELRSLP